MLIANNQNAEILVGIHQVGVFVLVSELMGKD